MKEQLIARWDAFLAKMRDRFNEAILYAQQAVLEELEDNNYDYYGAYRVLQGARSQIYNDLMQKVSETWQQQVEPMMRADGDYWPEQSYKAHQLTEWMNEQLQLELFLIEGRLSQKYYDHAIQLINKDFFCTQCNSPIEVRKDFFMAQYVTCAYCNAINTFEPETKYVTIGWNVVNNIAALHAFEEYKVMQATRAEGGLKYKKAVHAYYEKYFNERVKMLPHTASNQAHDLKVAIEKH